MGVGGLTPKSRERTAEREVLVAGRSPRDPGISSDVTGRVARSRPVGELGSGDHVVSLGQGRDLPAGVYWLRLGQGDRVIATKATIVR